PRTWPLPQSNRQRTTARSPATTSSSVSNRACGVPVKKVCQNRRTSVCPTCLSPSGGGSVFSKTQSSVISDITVSTSWRPNASLKASTVSLVFSGLALADHARDDFAEIRSALAERDRVHAVGVHHLRHLADMLDVDLFIAVVSRLRLRGARANQVRAVSVDLERDRDLRDEAQDLARQGDLGKGGDRLRD